MANHLVVELLQLLVGVAAVLATLFVIFLFERKRWRARRRRRAPPPTLAPPPRVTSASRPTPQGRCPFCHEDVDARDAVVCALCLARHHEPCWDEGAACGACRATERYERVASKTNPERERA